MEQNQEALLSNDPTLRALAAEVDAEIPLPGQEPAPVVDPAAEWAMLPRIFGGVLAMAAPELAQVYSEDACNAWGAAMVPLANKHGWSASGALAGFGPEIGVLMASAPLALGTVAVFRERKHRAEQEAAMREHKGGPTDADQPSQ